MRSPAATFDLRAALGNEISGALSELALAPARPRALHRCRVHLKRARALGRIGSACAPGLAEIFNDAARTAMRSLAQARDLAALAEASRTLAARARGKTAAALETLAAELEAQRAALPPLSIEATRACLRDLQALAQDWPEASPRQIVRGADQIAQRARRACVNGRAADDPALRHAWRKREKDRLYAAEILGDAWPEWRKPRLKRGERLGYLLGRERDMLLLIERLHSNPELAGGEKPARRAMKRLARRRESLAGRADKLGKRLHCGGA